MEQKNEYDFIFRTQKLLEQYDTLSLPKEEQYDVTLLINACVGLLFIAEENGWLPIGAKETMGLDDKMVTECYIHSTDKSELNAVCRHIRNAIAHSHFSTIGKPTISRLNFEDYYEDNKNFDMTISVEKFKEFLLDISNYVLANKKI